MKLLHKLQYKKKEAFRDASLMIIICEGKQREPDYFRYFDQLDSRLKIIVVQLNCFFLGKKYSRF